MDTQTTIGERIKAVRKAAGLSQEAVSKKTTLSLQAVGDIERGVVKDPHISSVLQIAKALGVHVVDLTDPTPVAFLVDLEPEKATAHLLSLPADDLLDIERALFRLLKDRYMPRVGITRKQMIDYLKSPEKRRAERVGELVREVQALRARYTDELIEDREKALAVATS